MFLRFARILVAVLCAMVVAQQTNLGSLAFGDECRDGCPDGGESHRCPLNCASCACVGHGTPVSLTLFTPAIVRPAVDRLRCDEPKRIAEPRPDAIFHVPRPSRV